jgi:hypothetical protein
MATPWLVTDRSTLETLFDELADELDDLGLHADIVMVGGAWLLWHAQRAATRDVDSARRFDTDLSVAIQRVASRHELAQRWLNDAAAAFWPAGASHDDCEIVYRRDTLVVRTPPPEIIFVMKLYRSDPQDREDMVDIWPMCSFESPDDAARAFRNAYPHAPEDEYLASYIAYIERDAHPNHRD